MRSLIFILSIILLLSACSSSARKTEKQSGLESKLKTKVRVENDNKLDMTIFVLRGGQRIRLGFVPSYTNRTFTLPDNVVVNATSIRLLADPIGGSGNPVSEEFNVFRGQTIEMVIANF